MLTVMAVATVPAASLVSEWLTPYLLCVVTASKLHIGFDLCGAVTTSVLWKDAGCTDRVQASHSF